MVIKAHQISNIVRIVCRKEVRKMEKDKLDLIKKIITLVDTKEGLKKVENAVDEVLRTQWDKEEKDRKEFEQWRKDKNENSDSIVDLPL